MQVGVFQSAGGGMSPETRLARLEEVLTRECQSLDLVVCPELFISGYNVGDDLHRLAQPADGSYNHTVAEIARKSGTAIIYGYPEKADERLYNSAACISSDGALVANHRKRANSPGSFEEDYFTPGNSMTLFTYQGLKIAILICYEVEFPETVREAASYGAELVVVPTALVDQWGIVAERIVPARAFENGVWVAYANHAGSENGFTYLGGSRIVAPNGIEAAIAKDREALIFAEVDVEKVKAAQARLPYLRDVSKFLSSDDRD
jgi:5-aminopentanamidase